MCGKTICFARNWMFLTVRVSHGNPSKFGTSRNHVRARLYECPFPGGKKRRNITGSARNAHNAVSDWDLKNARRTDFISGTFSRPLPDLTSEQKDRGQSRRRFCARQCASEFRTTPACWGKNLLVAKQKAAFT